MSIPKKNLLFFVFLALFGIGLIGVVLTLYVDFQQQKKITGKSTPQMMTAMINKTFDKNKKLSSEMNAMEKRHLEYLEVIDQKTKENSALEKKMSDYVALIQKLTKQKKDRDLVLDNLEKKLIKYRSQMNEDRSKWEDLQYQIQRTALQPNAGSPENGEKLQQQGQKLDDLGKRMDDIELEMMSFLDEVGDVRHALLGGTKPTPSVDELTQKYEQELAQAREIIAQRTSQTPGWMEEKEAYHKKITELEAETKRLKSKEKAAMAAIRQLQLQRETMTETSAKESKETVLETAQRIEAKQRLAEELRKTTAQLKDTETELREIANRLNEANKEKQALIEKNQEMNNKLARAASATPATDRLVYHYNLGLAYVHAGLFRKAASQFKKVLKIDPTDAEAHYNLGILYEEHLNNIDLGIEHYEKFLRYATDKEKKIQVKNWVRIAQRKYGTDRESYFTSAKDAAESFLLTKPS